MAFHVGQVKEAAAPHQRRGDPLAHFVITILGQRRADDRATGVGNVGEVGAGVLAITFAVADKDPERRPLPAHEAPAKRRDETGECVNASLLILPPEPAMLREAFNSGSCLQRLPFMLSVWYDLKSAPTHTTIIA